MNIDLTRKEIRTLQEAIEQAATRYEEIIEDGIHDDPDGDHEANLNASLKEFGEVGHKLAVALKEA